MKTAKQRAFIVALLLLLSGWNSAALAAEIKPDPSETVALAKAQEGVRWYGIYVMGKKVGWQREEWVIKDDSFCTDLHFQLRLAILFAVATISMKESACFQSSAPFYARSLESHRDEDGKKVDIVGKLEGEEMVLTIDTSTQKRTSRIPASYEVLTDSLPWAAMKRMQPGDFTNAHSHDELTGRRRWQKLTLKGSSNKTILGRKQTVYEALLEDELGLKLDMLLSEDGLILEGSVGPNMRIVLEDEKTAKDTGKQLLDFYTNSFVKATGKIDYSKVHLIKKMQVKLSGQSKIDLAPSRRQHTDEEGDKHRLVTVSACSDGKDAQPGEKYRKCSADLPCDLPQYKEQAAQIVGKEKTVEGRAAALTLWIHKNFKYALGAGGGTADQILDEKKGDCTEFSKTLVLLARAQGLAARQVSGVALSSDSPPSFGYHAWAEVFVPGRGWVAYDPTWGHHPVDASHIIMDVEEGLGMALHLGSLKIDILGVEYANEKEGLTCD